MVTGGELQCSSGNYIALLKVKMIGDMFRLSQKELRLPGNEEYTKQLSFICNE